MKFKITLHGMALLAGLLAVSGPVRADQDPAEDGKKHEPMDARTLLEKGRASGSLPEGVVIRIGACLGAPDVTASGDWVPDELHETWEFTSNQVHRVVCEYEKDKGTYYYNRVESRPFNSKGLCKDLLEGKAIEIQARKGKGPEVGFVGTRYHLGSRDIEVVWNGETILDLLETNGAVLDLYRESDARAFGALYERLASQARAAFKAKGDEERGPSNADRIVWGRVVKGLQLGISPPAGTNGVAAAVFDGSTLHVQVHLRNAGKSPVRLLASTYDCLAFGPDGAILVSKLILTPKTSGAPLAITYQGMNHLRLLDKRRPKSEGWQETLSKGSGSGEDIQLDAKEVESWTTLLAPGQTLSPYQVEYAPGEDSESSWRLTSESNLVPKGKYQLAAVLIVDQKVSPWKGKLTSGSLEVEIHPLDRK